MTWQRTRPRRTATTCCWSVALLMFLVGTLLAVLTAGFGLWRAHALRWWGAIGLVVWLGYVFVGPEARLAALVNLALLLPFVGVAQRLAQQGHGVPARADGGMTGTPLLHPTDMWGPGPAPNTGPFVQS